MKRENSEKLYLAISEIDESIIEEASTPITKSNRAAQKIIAVAASAAIVTVGVIASSQFLKFGHKYEDGGSDMEGAPDYEASAPEFGDDIPSDNEMTSDIGTLILTGREDNTFSFDLKIYVSTDLPLHIHLYTKSGKILYSTDPDLNAPYKPIITVDGESADSLPGKIGSYKITVEFTEDTDIPTEPDFDIGESDDTTAPNNQTKADYFIIDNFGPVSFRDFE